MPLFTKEELAELAAADEEIEHEFRLTNEDLKRSRALDRLSALEQLPVEKRKIAENQRAYYEANREKYNDYMREYMRLYRIRKGKEKLPNSGRTRYA